MFYRHSKSAVLLSDAGFQSERQTTVGADVAIERGWVVRNRRLSAGSGWGLGHGARDKHRSLRGS